MYVIYIWNVLVAFNEIYKPETSVNTIWNRWFPERKCPSDLHLIPRWRSRNSGDGWCGDRSSGICGRWTLARGDRSPWVGWGVDLRDISHGGSMGIGIFIYIYYKNQLYVNVGKYTVRPCSSHGSSGFGIQNIWCLFRLQGSPWPNFNPPGKGIC